MSHLALLDGVRGLCSVLVVLHHAFIFYLNYGASRRLNPGKDLVIQDTAAMLTVRVWFNLMSLVEVFFVLTGLLAARGWRRDQTKSYTACLGTKLVRFWPMLAVCCGWHALVMPLRARELDNCPTWRHSWPNLMLINNFGYFIQAALHSSTAAPMRLCLTETWSLSTQMQFHAAMPVIMRLVAGAPSRTALLLCTFIACAPLVTLALDACGALPTASMYEHIVDPTHCLRLVFLIAYPPWVRAGSLLNGVGVAELLRCSTSASWWRTQSCGNGLALGAGALVALVLVSPLAIDEGPLPPLPLLALIIALKGTITGNAIGALLLLALDEPTAWLPRTLAAFLGWRGWRLSARLSYSIYMLHCPVLIRIYTNFPVLEADAPPGSWACLAAIFVRFFVTMVICTPLAMLAHALVEERLSKALLRRLGLARESKRADD